MLSHRTAAAIAARMSAKARRTQRPADAADARLARWLARHLVAVAHGAPVTEHLRERVRVVADIADVREGGPLAMVVGIAARAWLI